MLRIYLFICLSIRWKALQTLINQTRRFWRSFDKNLLAFVGFCSQNAASSSRPHCWCSKLLRHSTLRVAVLSEEPEEQRSPTSNGRVRVASNWVRPDMQCVARNVMKNILHMSFRSVSVCRRSVPSGFSSSVEFIPVPYCYITLWFTECAKQIMRCSSRPTGLQRTVANIFGCSSLVRPILHLQSSFPNNPELSRIYLFMHSYKEQEKN